MGGDGDILMAHQHWSHIWRGAVIPSIAAVLTFSNIVSWWKWVLLALAAAAACAIVLLRTGSKTDLFAAVAIVLLTGLAAELLQMSGML